LILLSDTNVLIDLGHVGGIKILGQLGAVEVLDVVLLECKHPSQPDLVKDIVDAGISQIQTDVAWVKAAARYRKGNLSVPDALNIFYAKTFGCTLLTNEKPMRLVCQQELIIVHGTLWIIEAAYQQCLVPNEELCQWLLILSKLDRRLPVLEIANLRQKLGC